MTIIGKDKIYGANSLWIVSLNNSVEYLFHNKQEAIDFYCKHHCNPLYNDVHYDCECCPIKN